ncbi:hypothetical protein [Desulfoscipio gibsoniae]|uniref:hypothetical protein n=1 Tax=Desulfoscipio gibsoniae TaxID=102134 RepID=UPI001FDF72BC|nr:hypothetical protein [Desulfoscipio gibsoniae]
MESFSSTTAAQVQIINAGGMVLADSQGAPAVEKLTFDDIQRARKGELGHWQGNLPDTGEPAMSVAYPLKSGDQVVGAVCFITSLTVIHEVVRNVYKGTSSAGSGIGLSICDEIAKKSCRFRQDLKHHQNK